MSSGFLRFPHLFAVFIFVGSAACLGDNGSSGPDDSCQLDASEREMLDRVNEARAQARECGEDSFDSVDPVTWSCQLENAAQVHSDDMAEVDFFSHTGSDGRQVSDRVDRQDYSWSAVGENIAAGHPSASVAVESWLSSPGHCRNIMDPRFTEMGVATAEAPDRDVSPYWTQVFARPVNH